MHFGCSCFPQLLPPDTHIQCPGSLPHLYKHPFLYNYDDDTINARVFSIVTLSAFLSARRTEWGTAELKGSSSTPSALSLKWQVNMEDKHGGTESDGEKDTWESHTRTSNESLAFDGVASLLLLLLPRLPPIWMLFLKANPRDGYVTHS